MCWRVNGKLEMVRCLAVEVGRGWDVRTLGVQEVGYAVRVRC